MKVTPPKQVLSQPVMLPIDKIKLNPDNPRIIKDDKYKKLLRSLKEFPDMMSLRPIVVNKKMIILGGNMRYQAAKESGWEEIPVVIADLTPEQEREFVIKDNVSFGEWNWDALGNTYEFPKLESWGLDVPGMYKRKAEEDNFDTMKPVVIKTKPGDLYELNGHRLMCGDSTSAQDMERLTGGVMLQMIFTDPPYNVAYEGEGEKTSTTIKNDNMPEEDFRLLLSNAFANIERFSEKNCPLYVCYASRTHREFEDSLNATGWSVRNQIIWVKALATFGWGDYRWKHEPILYCHKAGQSLPFFGDRKQYTEWDEEPTDQDIVKAVREMIKKDEAGNSTVWRFARDSKYEHPTQKPILLIAKAILNSSSEGSIVGDVFFGGGGTLIACEQLGRIFYGMELDPRWVDVTIARWIHWMKENEQRFEVKLNGKLIEY